MPLTQIPKEVQELLESAAKNYAEHRRDAAVREQEKLEAEAHPPRFVIHTVHGTFAKNASWVQDQSRLGMRLREGLGWRVRIVPFRWSGRNLFSHRASAAGDFRRHLYNSLKENPRARHFVIAHSHGGNVAFMALDSEDLCRRIAGVVTLGTPFLSSKLRSIRTILDPGAALFAALFGGWSVLFYGMYQGRGWALWPWALGAVALLLGLMFLGALAAEGMERHARQIHGSIRASRLPSEQVAVIRHQTDEASAALSGARLAGTLTNLVWRAATAGIFERVNDLLSFIDYGRIRSTQRGFEESIIKRDDLPGASLLLTRSEPWYSAKTIGPAVLQAVPPLMAYVLNDAGPQARLWTMVALGLFGLPAIIAVALVVLGIPAALVSGASLLPCGWTAPLAGPYLSLAAEPTPPGTWSVTSFETDANPRGLSHSQAYDDYEVLDFILKWIQERSGPR